MSTFKYKFFLSLVAVSMSGAFVAVTPALAPVASASATTFPALNASAGSAVSYNWSGYIAGGTRGGASAAQNTFTGVGATWTVPAVSASGNTSADATWVGIGGVKTNDLIQAGTQAVPASSGNGMVYQAWIETLPQSSQVVPLTIAPGEVITVSLTQTAADTWSILMQNNTTGQTYQANVQYDSSLSSAEWVQEMPSSDRSVFIPLDDFGTVTFTNGYAIDNGARLSIAGTGAQAISMVNGQNQPLSTPSGLGTDGASFAVTRSSYAATALTSRGVGLGRGHRVGVGVQGYTAPQQPSAPTAPSTPQGQQPTQTVYVTHAGRHGWVTITVSPQLEALLHLGHY